jgi:TRAP transporter TAXI family solute receptor
MKMTASIHRWLLRLLGLLLLLSIAGCARAPDAEALAREVQVRLASALPEGTVSVLALHRRGSQFDSKAPPGQERRIVYYDVELKLARDFDFGAWDAPGVAGLVSAFGTGPKGISGIASGGNKTGDLLRVHATALYQREPSGGWVAVAPAGYAPAAAPAYAGGAPANDAAAALDAMRKIVDSVSKGAGPAQQAMIEEELAAAHAAIRARLARADDGYAIAAGPVHGQYLRFAQALSDPSLHTVALVTHGGEENLRLLRAGKVSLALAQGDAALAAYEGREAFKADGPDANLRAIGSLYPEPVHVLVRADEQLSALAGLRGRRIAIGLPGSASRTVALRVLQAHRLGAKDYQAVELSLGDALRALQRKEVAAVIQVIGVPADSIRDAMAELPMRLLPLAPAAIAELSGARTGLFASKIVHGSYASQSADVPTVATPAVLLAGPDLSDVEVTALTRFVFAKGRDFAARGSAQGPQVRPGSARQNLLVPLHTAAARELDALEPAAAAASAAQ